ncbi:NAD(P)/FAD-dependent oxidoreductase [Sediminibacterium sp.]|uniref:phytoene desaturase family protein n=1 Tax=Sediminibacterium sp. TaxID=1917865 RepID=UPI00271607DE|nr:phytoene desaturase family protein [Sediminibacterium sp.]MDO9000463.1 phytoene desaturase family protein [Bacteroidota bacterium]MDP3146969.1 phytoene desaturase family protein [Bacteroidota bacterium]MDP3567493.1 phytoene desaturase family protein [Sediminibacterium sp.]
MSKKKIAIIGAGFSGLSSACYLAKSGFDVTVYEKHNSIGGRSRSYSENGFVFDMGPSWYWMPDIFEKFFADFGKNVSDYYDLVRLSPSYRVFFSDDYLDVPASLDELYALFERYEPGSSSNLKQFLKEAEYKYNVGMHDLVYKPGINISELIDMRLISGVFKLDVFKSMSSHVRKLFKNQKLIKLLEFPVLFLGALPEQTPALYSLMNYADLVLGTWYPMGGMQKIAQGMYELATELGVKFETEIDIQKIVVDKNIATSILANKKIENFDALVSSADYHFTEQKLLDEKDRKYTAKYWESRKMAPSCLIYYVGVKGAINNLLHHNLFFDADFQKHSKEIYTNPKWPDNPLFYVCCPSKTDNSVAPEGHENLFILIPVAPGITDTEEIREKYFKVVVERLKAKTGFDVKNNLVYCKSYAPSNFVKDYNAFKGNAYGLANTLMQTAHLKPSLRSKKVKNLFYTGQLTVPGPGVPPSLISGKLAAEQILNFF